MLVLRGTQAVGLFPHLSHLIYIYKSKITKYMYMSSAPYTVTEKLLYIIKGPMKVISGLLPETLGYFCMKNIISTTRNCHSHIHESTHFILFALLKVHPRFCIPRLACGPPRLMGPGVLPWLTPPPPSRWSWVHCETITKCYR
jgi:hypothetical protein